MPATSSFRHTPTPQRMLKIKPCFILTQAIAKAGSQCCSRLQSALVSASSQAESQGQGDKFSSAAANAAAAAGFKGCAQQSFVSRFNPESSCNTVYISF